MTESIKEFILFIFLASSLVCAQSDNPLVLTEFGAVEGISVPIHTGDVIDSFLGIPFARAPVGQLRFEVSSFSFKT